MEQKKRYLKKASVIQLLISLQFKRIDQNCDCTDYGDRMVKDFWTEPLEGVRWLHFVLEIRLHVYFNCNRL